MAKHATRFLPFREKMNVKLNKRTLTRVCVFILNRLQFAGNASKFPQQLAQSNLVLSKAISFQMQTQISLTIACSLEARTMSRRTTLL